MPKKVKNFHHIHRHCSVAPPTHPVKEDSNQGKAAATMRFGSTLILLQSFVGGGYSFTVDSLPSISGNSHHTKSKSSSAINYADNSDLDSVIPLPPLDEIIKQQRPVRRRSFLHQLDRFLTDLQGEISFLHIIYFMLPSHLHLFICTGDLHWAHLIII